MYFLHVKHVIVFTSGSITFVGKSQMVFLKFLYSNGSPYWNGRQSGDYQPLQYGGQFK